MGMTLLATLLLYSSLLFHKAKVVLSQTLNVKLMKTQLALALTLCLLSMTACDDDIVYPYNGSPQAVPTESKKVSINSFFPQSGKGGSTVGIFGENFGSGNSGNNVTFGGQYAEITQVQPGILVVRVPMNLVEGNYLISISANGGTAEAGSAFKVTTEN